MEVGENMKYRQIRKLLKIMSTTKWKIINKGEANSPL